MSDPVSATSPATLCPARERVRARRAPVLLYAIHRASETITGTTLMPPAPLSTAGGLTPGGNPDALEA
jgi:hypothetical protein